ncbi:MAG: hypothetical protein EOS58_06230 [Mesorhizobium sp.]|uniref:hypothetical protein n=1 Tax=Mesorhizobium sp. M4A.F.Ca.ET.022.05.2.1 TaxID=2496653 RepID=UPI000FCAF7AE|nr:hypothetical protein [Mesorhizobium sp. M4A.F.Ca.ET.022.05.2.1]RVC78056.1 hypothetical protein EN745_20060 [Mesorhizobium sp. M4A.F.Ca.ET.022.05.2.1]RWD06606.1 MAG: hypothetical protein EOS58_06230 [Mesorhizobium sp.]
MNYEWVNNLDWINVAALAATVFALGLSLHFWRRQFRPLVTAMVKTHKGDNTGIYYDLVVLNSGSIPARYVWFEVADAAALQAAFGKNPAKKDQWLYCFARKDLIPVLHNGTHVSCSFGMTQGPDSGFWKNLAEFPIRIHYKGWFGKSYTEEMKLRIVDSDTFTGFMWE